MQDRFEKLQVWQKSMALVTHVYELTKSFPKQEQFGIISQMRRAAVSIPANIAEGKGRLHKKEYAQFLHLARGSLYELLTLVQVSWQLSYLSDTDKNLLNDACSEIAAMLHGLIQSIA